jgi:hypothetical protein
LTCFETDRIRAILETHELVQVDTRPFDPTLCGFQSLEPHSEGLWENAEWQILKTADGNLAVARSELQSWPTAYLEHAPWPATQSDGETLLRLLGALEP